jgi:NADH:ubiquinone oxidoreductase subunit F (NADH-binding)
MPVTGTQGLPRLLKGLHGDGRPVPLAAHTATHGRLRAPLGPIPSSRGRNVIDQGLIDLVERSGLRGRGGANFPTARKLSSVAHARGRPVVVANGTEGEPESRKDRVLLTRTPHLVLDGAALAAQAVGAHEVIVATDATTAKVVSTAIAERTAAGVDTIPPVVTAIPERFIAGEETALVSYLNGGAGLPTFVPPRPYERGVRGEPTLIQNVETLAHLALIARYGHAWFREAGAANEPGSTLITLHGAVRHPGVYEIARGQRLRDVIARAGDLTRPVQAFLIGGYAGAWLYANDIWESGLSDRSLAAHGGTLAAGVVYAFPAEECGLVKTAAILAYLAGESAGQCGPCVHGLAAIASAASDLARGTARRDVVQRLENWAWQVTGRGACHHPDGATRLLLSALRTFAEDVAAHRDHAPCLPARRHTALSRPTDRPRRSVHR